MFLNTLEVKFSVFDNFRVFDDIRCEIKCFYVTTEVKLSVFDDFRGEIKCF